MPVLFESPTDKSRKNPPSSALSVMKEKQEKHAMGAYLKNPRKIHFATQGSHEQIVLFLRQHPITQLPWVLSSLILIFIPVFVFPMLLELLQLTIPSNYLIVATGFWYVMVFAYVLVNFIFWYFNVNIVTNQRIVDIDFIYLLVQKVTATRISQIEDVTFKRVGVFASLFDYGDVHIQTAGPLANIDFLRVPQPRTITRVVVQLMGQAS